MYTPRGPPGGWGAVGLKSGVWVPICNVEMRILVSFCEVVRWEMEGWLPEGR